MSQSMPELRSPRPRTLVFRTARGSVRQLNIPGRWQCWILGVLVVSCYVAAHPLAVEYLQLALQTRKPELVWKAISTCGAETWVSIQNTLSVTREPLRSSLPTVRLTLSNNTLPHMVSALKEGNPQLAHEVGGDKPYFPALVEQDLPEQNTKEGKIAFRGAMSWHHDARKPSLRIKLKKSNARGDRYLELTTPEDCLVLRNWLPEQMAAELGLMTSRLQHARLFINNRYFGVYQQSQRPGEPLALANHRLPGTFFKGDFHPQLWTDVAAWKTFGDAAPEDLAAFDCFLNVVRSPASRHSLTRLERWVDLDGFARWTALMTAIGSIHTDDTHNHTYFFCPNQGKLEILPWDPNGFGTHADPRLPLYVQNHPLARLAHHDPRWVHLTNVYLYQLLRGCGAPDELRQQIQSQVRRMRPDLLADSHLGNIEMTYLGWRMLPVSVLQLDASQAELEHWIQTRHDYLMGQLRDARVAVAPAPDDSRCAIVTVSGHVTVTCHSQLTSKSLPEEATAAPTFSLTLHPGLAEDESVYGTRPYERVIKVPYLEPAPLRYRVAQPAHTLRFRNAVTGEPVLPATFVPGPDAASRSIAPSEPVPERVPTEEIVLGPGRVDLYQSLYVGREQRLTIRPGTEIRLAADASIFSRGRVNAVGTAEAPIRIVPLSESPWGTWGITGERTKGTILAHVHAHGGSTGQWDGLRFKGMVNVYNCPQVTLRHCQFGPNHFGDDTVNLAESHIDVEHCRWHQSLSDALDLDGCTGTVRQCHWYVTGNDGLDLMASQVHVAECYFEQCGDKGISVGEASKAEIENCRMLRCHIGTELKDDSQAIFHHCSFEDCFTGAHAYQKKWFYRGGGAGVFVECQFQNSSHVDLSPEKRSRLVMVQTAARTTDFPENVYAASSLPANWATEKLAPAPLAIRPPLPPTP